MKFSSKIKFSFRGRLSILTVGMVLAVLSLLYTNKLADVLKQKEQNDVELWVAAMERVSRETFGNYLVDPLISAIVSSQNNIPFIITDENLNYVSSNRIPNEIIQDPDKFERKINELILPARCASCGRATSATSYFTASRNCCALCTGSLTRSGAS